MYSLSRGSRRVFHDRMQRRMRSLFILLFVFLYFFIFFLYSFSASAAVVNLKRDLPQALAGTRGPTILAAEAPKANRPASLPR